MSDEMLAARFYGPSDLRLERVERPRPGPGWVAVEPAVVGICGTDTHIYAGDFPSRPPVTLGHEISGRVAAVGAGVDDLTPGDRICVEPHLFCTTCAYCRSGREHLCLNKLAFGVHLDGGMAETVVLPRRTVYRVPDRTSLTIAALTEPLACSLHGFDRLAPRPGEPLAIIGAGPAGLINTALAVRSGAGPVVVIEPNPARRDLAMQFGADRAIDPSDNAWKQEALGITHGLGFDSVIEAVGGGETVENAIELAARGGRILVFGVATPDSVARIRPYEVFAKELALIGTVINPYTQGRAVQLLDRLPLDKLPITTVSLDAVSKAFDGSLKGAIKVQIELG